MTGYRKQVIVGIDPGTTTAYAILDSHGSILAIESGKEMGLDNLIRKSTKYGAPLLVGTDRKKCPDMINKFAAKTGAVKVTPVLDVSGSEKNLMTRKLKAKNSHQKDAFAAALVAYKAYAPLLNRIDNMLGKEGKRNYLEAVRNIVVTKKISIKKALGIASAHRFQ